jgi:hypothetical protein
VWRFQQQFRAGVERGVTGALSAIGLPVEVRVVLVGFAADDGIRPPICIEPGHGPLHVDDVATVESRAATLHEAEVEPTELDSRSPPRAGTSVGSRLLRGVALVEAIEASRTLDGLSFFASASTPINGYEVHTCVGIPTAALESLPAFASAVVDRIYVGRSLQHEVVAECLRRADQALYLPDPGTGVHALGVNTEDIVRSAASRVIDGAVYRATRMPADLFRAVNEFVSLRYERGDAAGRVVIADAQTISRSVRVSFARPISLRQPTIMRKLLEISDDSMCVLSDGRAAYGLGSSVRAPDVLEIAVRGHATWELSVGGSAYVKVSYGRAMLPRPLVEFSAVVDTAARSVGPIDADRIWRVIQAAQVAGHGTTLVVSSDPVGETSRLGAHAIPIAPMVLEPADVVRLARIDGAFILGPDGRCHALGVILDGTASGRGDAGRGARFNSAVRYQTTMAPHSLLVVISDDGTVDLIPRLRPRIAKARVEAAVEAFCTSCENQPVDGEEFARTHQRVKALAFYLNETQCQRVNDCYENEMRRRFEAVGVSLSETPLRPHPDMDDSYFLGSPQPENPRAVGDPPTD